MEAGHGALPRHGGIFISYRKGDEPFGALWIDQVLSEHFGRDRVFRDSKSIEFGEDFQPDLWTRLARCAVMVVVIGRGWEPTDWAKDFVRTEIRYALKLGLKVIPVLLGEVDLPATASLPEDIRALVGKQYVRLRGPRDADNIERLVKAIKPEPWRAGLLITASLIVSATSIAIEFATDLRFNLGIWLIACSLIIVSAFLNAAVGTGWPGWLLGRTARLTGPVMRWRPLSRVAFLLSVLLLVLAGIAMVQSPAVNCLTSKRIFDFEGNGTDGWFIRDEGGVKLGISLVQDGSTHGGEFGTNFTFEPNQLPLDKGQIAVESVPFRSELSAWVLAPKNAATAIQISAFVLERAQIREQTHWSFHWTAPRLIQPGQWQMFTFHPADFVHVQTEPPTSFNSYQWSNPPLLVGLEFRSAERNNSPVRSQVHLDDISVC